MMLAPLLAEEFDILEMIVLFFILVGRGLCSVFFVSEQHKIVFSLVMLSINAVNFVLSLKPLTLRVESVMRFL